MSEESYPYTYGGTRRKTIADEAERMRTIYVWYKKELGQAKYLLTADPQDIAMFEGIADAYETMFNNLKRMSEC